MKKTCIAIFICVTLICSLFAMTASAWQVEPGGYISCDKFTTDWWMTDNHRENLGARGIYNKEHASFSEGLLLIIQGLGDGSNSQHNYVNLNGDLVDLNRGRFSFLSTFYEGLAAFRGHDGSSGYINKEGNIVLNTSKYNGSFHYGVSMCTRFVNGKTIVHNNDFIDLYDLEEHFEIEAWQESQYGVNPYIKSYPFYYIIDTKGNVVETIDNLKALTKHPLFETAICSWPGVPLGVMMDPSKYEPNSYSPPVDTPIIEQPTDYIRPEMPLPYDAETQFQSTGKITSVILGDLDFSDFVLTITNDTDYTDSGVIAVVAANVDGSTTAQDNSGVFFVPYYVGPHSSIDEYISHRNIVHMYMFGENALVHGATASAEALAGQIEARVIHFDDVADLTDFYELIPYEQNWKPQNLVNEFQSVCNGQAGSEFLSLLNINRPNCDMDTKHNICRR